MHKLPLDISAITDLEQIEDVPWPICESTLLVAADVVYDSVKEVVSEFSYNAHLLATDNAFNGFLIQYIHAQLVILRCGGASQLAIGELARPIYKPNLTRLAFFPSYKPRQLEVKPFFLGLAKSIKENNGRISCRQKYLSLGSSSRMKKEFLAGNCIKVRARYVDDFLRPKLAMKISSESFDVADAFVGKIDRKLADVGLGGLPGKSRLARILRLRYSRINQLVAAFQPVARNYNGLVVTQAANALHKMVSKAFMAEGKPAVAVDHGNSFAHMGNIATVCGSHFSYSHFVSPTKNIADANMARRNHFLLQNLPVSSYISIDTNFYDDLYSRSRKISKMTFSKIERVMIVGYPMNANTYPVPGGFFYRQLQLLLSLCRHLNRKKIKIIYKAHPERKKYITSLIAPYVDIIETKPFEKTWVSADLFLFTHSHSTTFGFALNLPRPIILVDWEKSYWMPDQSDCLKRRCRLIRSGSVPIPWFNTSDLDAGLDAAPKHSDGGVFEYFHSKVR